MKEVGDMLDIPNKKTIEDEKQNKIEIARLEQSKQACKKEIMSAVSAIRKYELELKINRIDSEISRLKK